MTTSEQNPDSRKIDIKTQEGLEQLKAKAKYYGHYADQLLVLKLIAEIEELRGAVKTAAHRAFDSLP